jgi:site-specific DNA-methyltransferase (adenine-specific)
MNLHKHIPSSDSLPAIVITASGPVVESVIADCVRALQPGGLLFVYGSPRDLPAWGAALGLHLTFKYWIALDLNDAQRAGFLKPTHQGLLLYWKPKRYQTYPLHAKAVRIPHTNCAVCHRPLKDWGGKKHLMNPAGAALSDVWRDLPRRPLKNSALPADVAERLRTLAGEYHVVAA